MKFKSCELIDRNSTKRYQRNINSLVVQDLNEYRAHYLVDFSGTFSIGTTRLSLVNDFFTITGPGDNYFIATSNKLEYSAYYLMTFEIEKNDENLAEYIDSEIAGKEFILGRTSRFLFDDIIRMNISGNSNHIKASQYTFLSLLYSLSSSQNQSGGLGRQELIDKATEYMRGQLREQMQLKDLSQYLNISPPHLVRLFTATIGISPIKYYSRAKVEAAASMLINTDRTIASIAEEFGFSSAPHLSKIFKQYMAVSPRSYRNNYVLSSKDRKVSTMKELENAYELLHRIVDESPDFVFYKDVNGTIMYCNKSFCRLLGRPLDQVIGKTDYDLFPREEAEFYIRNDMNIFRTRQPYKNQEQMSHSDGSKRNFEVYKAPFYDGEGTLLGLIGISREITDR